MNENETFHKEILKCLKSHRVSQVRKEAARKARMIHAEFICDCGHIFYVDIDPKYRGTLCPIQCPKCNESLCPVCGSNKFDGEDMEYCGKGCSCGWEHCGDCD